MNEIRMSETREIYLDFNNRLAGNPNAGEFYKTDLAEVEGLAIGTIVFATDQDSVSEFVEICTLLPEEGTAIVKIVEGEAIWNRGQANDCK